MKCERCGERPARIRYTEYREGEAEKLRVCEECARELGFDPSPEEPGSPAGPPAGGGSSGGKHPKKGVILGVVSIEAVVGARPDRPPGEDELRCPGCGITGRELRGQSLLGCPSCYDTFADLLDDLLRRVHGATAHRGRLPGGRTADPVDEEALRRELHEAVEREEFERAARLRDRLRRLERSKRSGSGEEEA